MNINKNKLISKKAGLSYLQISILIIASFAFAYLVCQASGTEILPEVSAQAINCCSLDNSGNRCQEYFSTNIQDNCNGTVFPGRCSDFSECKIGCCFNPNEGNCVANSPKGKCEGEGGEWYNDGACNIVKCEKGCCLLGGEARFVTSKNCEVLSSFLGFEKYFMPEIKTEVSCIILSELQDKGACVLDSGSERTCKFTTRQECISLAGDSDNFVKNSLCTNPELNTTCKKTQETICIEGKEEVYFVDSCGNPANIYDSSKVNDENYWKEIIFKTESCGTGGSNTESKTCGNCDGLQSKCKNYAKAKVNKPSYGDNICADLSCKDAPANGGGKQDRKNLESWCVYDGKIGNGDDVAGSRHFKYVCVEGEVQFEACADFRNELCVESRDSNA
ncbi:MAG TPA: hypothetical protein VMZ91_10230, partial [Candidatus Paceibacterota bacterium]|nr:hypothetical protein [Candidatus Paceibacterota bacterium]